MDRFPPFPVQLQRLKQLVLTAIYKHQGQTIQLLDVYYCYYYYYYYFIFYLELLRIWERRKLA